MTCNGLVAPVSGGDLNQRISTCLSRAEELRLISEDVRDEDCRLTLLRLAIGYECAAASLKTGQAVRARASDRAGPPAPGAGRSAPAGRAADGGQNRPYRISL